MVWTKLLGGLTGLAVLAGALGSLAVLLPSLPSNRPALVVVALVAVAMGLVVAAGIGGRSTGGNPYW